MYLEFTKFDYHKIPIVQISYLEYFPFISEFVPLQRS